MYPNNTPDVNATAQYYISGPLDPTVTPVGAAKGTIYIKNTETVGAWQKQSDGVGTDWQPLGGGSGPIPIPVNPQNIYVDAVAGDDMNDGTVLQPVLTLERALFLVADGGPGNYRINLAPGVYEAPADPIPSGVALVGGIGNVEITGAVALTAQSGEGYSFSAQGIKFAEQIIVDMTANTGATLLFTDSEVKMNRVDSEQNVYLNIYDSKASDLVIGGSVRFNNALINGDLEVPAGAVAILQDCTIAAGNATVEGELVLTNTVCLLEVTGGGTIRCDAATKSLTEMAGGAFLTAAVISLDRAQDIGFVPANPSAWGALTPSEVKAALDYLASKANANTENVRYVAKNGSDATGNGSILNPYLTVKAAMDSITDATNLKRYVILVQPGRYDEIGLTVKANVFVVGLGNQWFPTRISNNVPIALDANFVVANDIRSGFTNVNLGTAVNLDFNAVSSNEGKFYFNRCQITSSLTITKFSNINQVEVLDSWCFGALTFNGSNSRLQGCLILAGLTVNSAAGGTAEMEIQNCAIYSSLSFLGDGSNNIVASIYGSGYLAGDITADGAGVSLTSDASPLAGAFNITNGATFTRLNSAFGLGYNPGSPGSWPVVPNNVKDALDTLIGLIGGGGSVPPLTNVKYVAKNGNDATGDGSIGKPYLTVNAAIGAVGTPTATSRAVILVAPGQYSMSAMSLKAHTFLVGLCPESVELVSSGGFDLSGVGGTSINNSVSGFVNMKLSGTCNFQTRNATGFDTLVCQNVEFNGAVVIGGGLMIGRLYSTNCKFLSTANPAYSLRIRNSYLYSKADEMELLQIYPDNSGGATPRARAELTGTKVATLTSGGTPAPTPVESIVTLNSSPVEAFDNMSCIETLNASVDSLNENSPSEIGSILVRTSLSRNLGYDPSVPADWGVTPPEDARSALDYLAANKSNKPELDYHTVTALEIAAKQFALSPAAKVGTEVQAMFVGGSAIENGVDFNILSSGTIFNWNGLGLDGFIEEGNQIQLYYEKL